MQMAASTGRAVSESRRDRGGRAGVGGKRSVPRMGPSWRRLQYLQRPTSSHLAIDTARVQSACDDAMPGHRERVETVAFGRCQNHSHSVPIARATMVGAAPTLKESQKPFATPEAATLSEPHVACQPLTIPIPFVSPIGRKIVEYPPTRRRGKLAAFQYGRVQAAAICGMTFREVADLYGVSLRDVIVLTIIHCEHVRVR
jgi:hypothetical protein